MVPNESQERCATMPSTTCSLNNNKKKNETNYQDSHKSFIFNVHHTNYQAFFLMALLPSSSSSSSSFTYAFSYQVFLSFRGTDTRFGFTGNLYKALLDKGIHTFIDDEDLNRGDEITPALTKAIQESRIAIPIFSVNYASSSFCLDELVTIMECVKAKGRLVLPIFYDVDPSHVRHQIGTYGEALAKHEKRFKNNKEKLKENIKRLQKWKMALNQAANLSGSHFKLGNEYEHQFIGKILNEVSNKLSRIPLHVADYPVGLESRVLEVMSCLDVGSDDGVQMVGIYGIGGMGKTTLAQAVYNLIADQFEDLCFLHNVRENSAKYGLEHLQENILSKTIGLNIKLGGVSEGISVIKQRLNRKKVLLILDDVDKLEQLRSLVGEPNWFGSGSRVIITTRDKHLLSSHGVERTYEVYGLDTEEALELLRWNAFKADEIDPCYENVLNQAVAYASCLPLALEVIGSNLNGKSINEWESALAQYERITDKKIQKILKVSFDGLDEEQQSVFLDIACCFKGYGLKNVENILHAHHDHCIKYHIGVLVEKSLIKISSDEVTLHDLLEHMGKEIVRQESPKVPGKRSRLWSHKDIIEVLEENTGSSKIEMIHLEYSSVEEVDWDGEAFKGMKQLKTLIIRKSHFSKGPKHLPNSLRVLEWWEYPSQYFPCDFHPKKLLICKFPLSSLMSLEFLSSSKKFVTVKVLNFNECNYLTQIPNLFSLPNLEELSFMDCRNLITIDHTVGLLDKLKLLDARRCDKLTSFPPLKLPSLKVLELSECSSLKSFPEILVKMENITELNLSWTDITNFPSSFQNLARLRTLAVADFPRPRSLVMMPPELADLTIYRQIQDEAYLVDEEIEEMRSMLKLSSKIETLQLSLSSLAHRSMDLVPTLFPNLKELDLRGSEFIVLPECMRECRFLWKLELDDCKQLREIEGIPPSLRELSAYQCKSLSFSSRSMLLEQELHEAGNTHFHLPSLGRIPEWFEHKSWGPSPSLSFWFRNKLPNKLLLCLDCPNSIIEWRPYTEVDFIVNGKVFSYKHAAYEYHTRLLNILGENFKDGVDEALLENEWNHVEVMVNMPTEYLTHNVDEALSENDVDEALYENGVEDIIGIGIHVLKEKSSMEDIQFTDPLNDESSDYETADEDFNSELL